MATKIKRDHYYAIYRYTDTNEQWVYHCETKKLAEKYLETCKRNWGMKCDGEFKIVEVKTERKVKISQIKER